MFKKILCLFTIFIVFVLKINAQNYKDSTVEKLLKSNQKDAFIKKYLAIKEDTLMAKSLNFVLNNIECHTISNLKFKNALSRNFNLDIIDSLNRTYQSNEDISKLLDIVNADNIYESVDLDSHLLTVNEILANIESAFAATRKISNCVKFNFNDFCNYILPYKVLNEKYKPWREILKNEFSWISDTLVKKSDLRYTINLVNQDINKWFQNTYLLDKKKVAFEKKSTIMLFNDKKGYCEDQSRLLTCILRSQGVPSTIDFIPYWSTSTGGHYFSVVLQNGNMSDLCIDGKDSVYDSKKLLKREPGKVFRVTYRNNENTIANKLSLDKIPSGFLHNKNFIDVTEKYWQINDIKISDKNFSINEKFYFLNVFNGLSWRTIWWGEKNKKIVEFKNVSKGVVYLPTIYKNGKHYQACYPIVNGYTGVFIAKPNFLNLKKIVIQDKPRYFIIKPNELYTLFYWDNGWKSLASQSVGSNKVSSLSFTGVPDNSLLILLPKQPVGKERVFVYLNNSITYL